MASFPQGGRTTSKRLLVIALLVAGCSDEVTPPSHGTAVPGFTAAATASGIALWGFNGTSGTELSKEFNPENPPLGSTVVATFAWAGSTNVIDSVSDDLWTGKHVGNRYNLVEYVTAGGISMATYVATNVQNFPSPKQALGEELLITAHLSTPISGGGTLVSAFTGVNPVFTQAVGAHRSATGSGSTTPTVAHPGATTVGAGQLVYAVSMTSEGQAGRTTPAGFTYIINNQMSSPALQFDAEYAVQAAAGSVDPAWGWSFNSPNTWLATAIALTPASGSANQPPVAAFTSGCSSLTCSFTSTSSDPDGSISIYGWDFGDGGTAAVQSPSYSYGASGTYTVTLTVTDNQGAAASASQSVGVNTPNQPPVANFVSDCPGLTCNFTSTSSDPDGTIVGYSWTFGDGASSLAQNASHTYTAGGAYTVTLTATDNLNATTAVSKTVTVNQPPVATQLAFTVKPSNTTVGTAISPPVRVTAQDGAGNTDASFNGTIYIALGANPGGGTLAGTRTIAAVNGVATFSNLSIDRTGSGYTLQATAAGLSGATSAAFNVGAPAGTGIRLDQQNGTMLSFPSGSTIMIKGFNPTNPHLGDAIIATFYWYGSTNIIQSVTDHLTDPSFTPVGNTYHLVEYRTAGGISMATYVATNVQNFPDPNPDQGKVLAVRANLTSPINEGAITISAYSGVAPTFSQALVASQSSSGMGTGITPADPGAIAVNAGALIYAVSMANGVFGSDKPAAPFVNLDGGMSDAVMVADGVYAVPAGAGSPDPRWVYYFDNGQYTWLASVLALNPAP